MGAAMFGNELFDQWLQQKSLEILSKVEKEKISNEDMLILSLKAQTNHFYHMDKEFREEFKKIDNKLERMDVKFEKRFALVDVRFEQVDQRFEIVDKKFDRMTTVIMWCGGLIVTLISGLYFKLVI
jgi:uncharacterized damage-inducible protein DinB